MVDRGRNNNTDGGVASLPEHSGTRMGSWGGNFPREKITFMMLSGIVSNPLYLPPCGVFIQSICVPQSLTYTCVP